MKLLIHVCCADCGIKLLDGVQSEFGVDRKDITLYFYNPNIHPENEFRARASAVKQIFINKQIKLVEESWTPKDFFGELKAKQDNVSGFSVMNKAHRCPVCWQVRLTKTFRYAVANGYTAVTSTLLSSIYHDTNVLHAICKKLSQEFSVSFLTPVTINHCLKTSGFYKQNYEGCVYSLLSRMSEKYGMIE